MKSKGGMEFGGDENWRSRGARGPKNTHFPKEVSYSDLRAGSLSSEKCVQHICRELHRD